MTTPSSTGIVTVITALSAAASRKITRCQRYGRAYPAIRRTVPGFNRCLVTDESVVNPRIMWSWPGPGCIAAETSSRLAVTCAEGIAAAPATTAPAAVKGT